MNIVIVGAGEVGYHLAKVLSREGHAVTVVDPDYQRIKRAQETLDVRAVQGDGCHPRVLDQAECDGADLLLCVSSQDRVNMLSCLLGRRMGARKAVLRVKDLAPFQGFRTFLRRNLEFDLLLSLEDLASEEVVRLVRHKGATAVEDFADGRVQMRRLVLDASRGKGKSLMGVPLKHLDLPEGMLVAALRREGETLVPGGEDVLGDGDVVYIIGEPKGVEQFQRRAGSDPGEATSVVLLGGVGLGLTIARRLEAHGIQPRILVEDRAEAEKLSAELSHAVVLHTEGIDLNTFREEHVGEADAFIGASFEDERNLMSCQLAKKLGTKRTVALVQKPDYVELYQQLGVDVAVSPRLLCADRIVAFIRAGAVTTIASIEEGAAEIVELTARGGAKVVGRPLSKVPFPHNAKVGAVCREKGDVLVPGAGDVVEAGDTLIVFTAAEGLQHTVDLITGKGSHEEEAE